MRSVSLLFVFILALSCSSDPAKSWNDLDLLAHGIPFSIMAPDSAEIKTADFGTLVKDVTIKKGDDYSIQIFASTASSQKVEDLKKEQLEEVKNSRYYSKLVKEMPSGFIYESKLDSNSVNYGFKYIKIQGDKEYLISNGMIGSFSEVEIHNMYEAVSKEKI